MTTDDDPTVPIPLPELEKLLGRPVPYEPVPDDETPTRPDLEVEDPARKARAGGAA